MITPYWQNLNDRERKIAVIGAICVFLYLFYLTIYSPLTSAVDARAKELSEKQQTLTWMQQVRQQSVNHKTAQNISNAKLLALIGNQLSRNSLQHYVYQLQQTSSGDIQLSYEQVPYHLFLTWLWALHKDYAIALKQFSAERTETAGVTKITLIFAAK